MHKLCHTGKDREFYFYLINSSKVCKDMNLKFVQFAIPDLVHKIHRKNCLDEKLFSTFANCFFSKKLHNIYASLHLIQFLQNWKIWHNGQVKQIRLIYNNNLERLQNSLFWKPRVGLVFFLYLLSTNIKKQTLKFYF